MTRAGTLLLSPTLACLLAACTPSAATDAGRDAAGSDSPAEPLAFAIEDGGPLVFLSDGDTVDLVWGLQGGTMITPSIVIPARVSGDVAVTLENVLSATGVAPADFPGYGPTATPTTTRDGVTLTTPVYDQLGWTALPEGTELELRARVVAGGRTYRGVVRLVLHATACPAESCACPDAPDTCFGPPDAPEPFDAAIDDDAGAMELDAGDPDAGA